MSHFVTFCHKSALPDITYTKSIGGIFLLRKVGGDFVMMNFWEWLVYWLGF